MALHDNPDFLLPPTPFELTPPSVFFRTGHFVPPDPSVASRVLELRRLGGLDTRFSNLLEKIPEKLLPASVKLAAIDNTGLVLLGLGVAAVALVGIIVWKWR